MQLRSDIQITTMIRALREVVLPAVDPANQLAVEQAQLIVGMLQLLQQQLPLQFRCDRDELQRLAACAAQLGVVCAGTPELQPGAAALVALRDEAAADLDGSRVDPVQLRADIARLRAAIGELVSAADAAAAPEIWALIERAVLDLSREQLLRDRALLHAQNWEPQTNLPDLASLLATPPASAGSSKGT